MAAVAVTFQGTRVNDAEAVGTVWLAGAAAPAQETEFVYQNTYSMSAQVKTTESGFYYYDGTTSQDMSTPKIWIAKVWVTNYGALDGSGLVLEIGTGSRANYYRYFIYTASTYPISGGWLIIPIDPNVSQYRSATTGTPTLTTINHFGIRTDFSTTSRTANIAMDAIDIVSSGQGLLLTGGDSTDADGTFQSFVTADEGTVANRWGLVVTKEGILYVVGTLTIGSATATVFTDSNRTIVFPEGRFPTGFSGIKVDLASSSSIASMTSITFVGRGQYGYMSSTQDTRPDFTVSNTSGSCTIDACNFINFRSITLTSAATVTDTAFNRCLAIAPAGGTLDNCTIEASPVATNSACITLADPTDITNCTFVSGGTGHAIEITSTTGSPFTFVGNTFSGYATDAGTAGDRAIYNNSGGAITLNITGSGTTPSVRNGVGASTTINNNVNLTITVQDEAANPIVGAQVAVYKTSDNSTIIASTATNASGIVSGAVAASTGAIYVRVRQSNTTDATRYFPTSTVGTIGTSDYSATITMIEDTTVT